MLVPLVVVGAGEAAWGVAALARATTPTPRLALGGAAVLTGGLVILLLLPAATHHHGTGTGAGAGAGGATPVGALVGAGTLDLVVALMLAARIRRGSDPAVGRPAAFLLGTAAAAAAVAAITVTSLAGTVLGTHHVH